MKTSEQKVCQNCKQTFTIEPEDFKFYEKMGVPAPTFCPPCRLQRRLAWRNERSLYRRPCDSCGKETISVFHKESPIPSYCLPCWWSDKWNPLDYGKEYDFSKPFFQQFRELMERVPHPGLWVSYKTLVNSDYNNMNHMLKNCYWLFNSDYDEDCLYGEEVEHSKDCLDVTMIDHSQWICQSVNCNKCYQIYFSVDCQQSHDIWFSKNLTNCSNCFGCVNLKNQQYRIFNKQYSKDEYARKIKEFDTGSFQTLQKLLKKTKEFQLQFPHKYMHGRNNTNVSGDYIYHSKNVRDTYIATESENCRYCMWLIVKPNKDCYDFTQFGENTQQVYEAMSCGKGIQNVICSGPQIIEGHSIRYSMHCFNNCAYLFGCIGLRSQKYCILNKKYTQDEYEALLPKIVSHMKEMPYTDSKGRTHSYGDFFPIELSHFGYNETSAMEYFPLSADEAAKDGYPWKESEKRQLAITMPHDKLPDHSKDIPDSITEETIGCEHKGTCADQCTEAFRVIPAEAAFYKKTGLPLPRLCPNCRHYERLKERNPLKLYQRACQCAGNTSENGVYKNTIAHFHKRDKCPNSFETTYAPERPEIVYCGQCYQAEVA